MPNTWPFKISGRTITLTFRPSDQKRVGRVLRSSLLIVSLTQLSQRAFNQRRVIPSSPLRFNLRTILSIYTSLWYFVNVFAILLVNFAIGRNTSLHLLSAHSFIWYYLANFLQNYRIYHFNSVRIIKFLASSWFAALVCTLVQILVKIQEPERSIRWPMKLVINGG